MTDWLLAISTFLACLGSAFILLCLYLNTKFKYWQRRGVKSPSFFDFLRSLPSLTKKPQHISQVEAYNKYGRLFGVYGPINQLYVADPESLKRILVKDFHIFRNRKKLNLGSEIFQKGLFFLVDEDWKRVRCIMSPTFSSSKMRKMAVLIKECSSNATKFFEAAAEKNEQIDFKEHVGAFAVDVIAATAFATRIDSLHDPKNEFLAHARMFSNRDVSIFKVTGALLFPRLARLLGISLFPEEPLQYFRGVALKILKEREISKTRGCDFLQLMMDAKDEVIERTAEDVKEENESGKMPDVEIVPKQRTMTLEEVISQCVLFFIGGHDTTVATMSFVAYNLALNQECQQKLIQEIDETWEKHGDVDFDIVSKMPYLDAVLSETLRLHAATITLMRLATQDYVLGDTGVTIPKDTFVVTPVYAMHHDPEWFPDPEKFDPNRFLPENRHLIPPYVYLPFGEGPRSCIGMRFVMMVMKLGFVYILRNLKFVATEETKRPLEYYLGQQLQAKRIPLKMEKRK